MTSTFRQEFPDTWSIDLLTFNVAISLILKMVSYNISCYMIYFVCITYFSSLSQGPKIFKKLKFSQINRNPGRGGEEGGKKIIHSKTSCIYLA